MRNTWLFVIATLLLLAGAWWQYQLVQNLSSPLPVPEPATTGTHPTRDLPADLQQMQQRHEAGQAEVRAIADIDPSPAPAPLWNLRLEGDQQTVELDRALIASAMVGDSLTLTLPDGEQVAAEVTQRVQRPSGNIHLTARYPYHGQDYPLILTQSSRQTFATLTTPAGIYELEAVNGIGRLVDSLENEHRAEQPASDIMPSPR